MNIPALFFSTLAVSYIALTVVGIRCAYASGSLVAQALGRPETVLTVKEAIRTALTTLIVMWLAGLFAITSTSTQSFIIKLAEESLHNPDLSSKELDQIRVAIQKYRLENAVYE